MTFSLTVLIDFLEDLLLRIDLQSLGVTLTFDTLHWKLKPNYFKVF